MKTRSLFEISFPVYVVHTDNIELIDGILWIDDQVLDDRNMPGDTLGKRRLQTPMKSLYPLKYMIENEIGLISHRRNTFIDSDGEPFIYVKTRTATIKYHKIAKIEKKEIATVLWLKGINFPFLEKRPPLGKWAGVLYNKTIPWMIFDFSESPKKDTWRKI